MSYTKEQIIAKDLKTRMSFQVKSLTPNGDERNFLLNETIKAHLFLLGNKTGLEAYARASCARRNKFCREVVIGWLAHLSMTCTLKNN